MRCPACQASPPDGSRFCPSCGHRLEMPDAVTVIAGSSSAVAEDVTRLLDSAPAPSAADSPRSGPVDVGFEPGAVLAGRYRIVRSLGRGGMGIVYHADDLRLGTIESGAGAGERITARSRCTFTRVACTIVAESFAA